MPCLSSRADSNLNDSIRVSNAESQLAVPFITSTDFCVSVISSPNGSAVWTGAGDGDGVACVAAAGGGAGVGLADGAGAGEAGGARGAGGGGGGGGGAAGRR